MRILIVRNYPNYMAIGKNSTYNIQELGLASALVRAGHTCDIVFWTNGKEQSVIYQVPKSNGTVEVYYKRAKTLLKNAIYNIDDLIEKYDIIQPCEYNQLQSLIFAKRYPNKTIVYHGQYYGKENRKYNIWCRCFDLFGLRLYKKNRTFFITKSILSKTYLADKGLDETHIFALGVGMNRDALENREANQSDVCTAIEDLEAEIKLLYVGEFMPRRHLKFMGDIIAELKKRGRKCKLIMIGKSNTDYGKGVKEYFENNNLNDNVYYVDRIEQRYLSRVYKACTAFLFPSTYEIFGMVLMEAMYFGLPVISCENGGSTMLIKNGINGFVENELNAKKWAEKIIQIKDGTITDISMNARNTILNRFTWDALVSQFIQVYEKRLIDDNKC